MDAERALQAALIAALRGAAGLAPLLGGRVYDEPPAVGEFPMLLVGRSESRPVGGLPPAGAAEALEQAVTLTAVSRFGGLEEAKALVALVRGALDGAALTLDGHRLVSLRVAYADVFRAADWRRTYGVVRVRAVTEAL